MVLPILCAGTLLAADYGLRSLARRGKLERALLGGRIRLELLENPGMAGGVLKNHPHLARALSGGALLMVLIMCRGELLHGRGSLLGCGAAVRRGPGQRAGAIVAGLCDRLYSISKAAGRAAAAAGVEPGRPYAFSGCAAAGGRQHKQLTEKGARYDRLLFRPIEG